MGLDMYLIRRKKGSRDFDKWWDENGEVAYWRKANAVHQWFVDNVQDGEDDCDFYKVFKQDVESLRDVCKRIIDNVVMEDGKIFNGYSYKKDENGKFIEEKHYEDGKLIKNYELCEELLPTTSGFFFGSTEYDNWYYDDVKKTYEYMEDILENFDFDNYDLYYHSSW